MATITDDLGYAMPARPRSRVVSLVPSLTESVASVNCGALVGATRWCTHPADLDVTRVRGTKNPDVAEIVMLRPDLVLANKEENRRKDIEVLRAAGIDVWVTLIESVPQAIESLRRMFEDALGWDVPTWLDDAASQWGVPAPDTGPRVVVPVWRDPWMVVGSRTFTGDLLARAGLRNIYADSDDRYPHVDLEDIRAERPDVVVLPDEPYRFTVEDGPDAFQGVRCALIEGRPMTWYGPSLVTTRAVLAEALAQ